MHHEGILSQAAVVGVTVGRAGALPDAFNLDIVGFSSFEFGSNEVREGSKDRVVDRVVPFLQNRLGVVKIDGGAELVDDVEVIVRVVSGVAVKRACPFAIAELQDSARQVEQERLTKFVQHRDSKIQVRVVVGFSVVLPGKDRIFDVGVAAIRPREVVVDEAVVCAVAGNVDNVRAAVRREREDVYVLPRFDNALDAVGTRVRIVFV